MAVLEINDLQDKVLETVRTTQDNVAEAVKGVVAQLPSLPYPDQLPKPAELVDRAWGYAQQVFDSQRDFVSKVVSAIPTGSTSS
jgi:hypothetical protein